MKKVVLLFGALIGFIFGSRSGRGPYEELESKVRKFSRRSEVKEAVGTVKEAASSTANKATTVARSKVDGAVASAHKKIDAAETTIKDKANAAANGT